MRTRLRITATVVAVAAALVLLGCAADIPTSGNAAVTGDLAALSVPESVSVSVAGSGADEQSSGSTGSQQDSGTPTGATSDGSPDEAGDTTNPEVAEPPELQQLMARPAPVNITSADQLDSAGLHEWRFANGLTVRLAPPPQAQTGATETGDSPGGADDPGDYSDIPLDDADTQQNGGPGGSPLVLVEARGAGGWSRLGPGDGALADVAAKAVIRSGADGFSRAQIDRYLGKSAAHVTLDAYISETHEGFTATAAPEDLEILFQLIHLHVTAPQVDPDTFHKAVSDLETVMSLQQTSPAWAARAAYVGARFHESWHPPGPTDQQLQQLTAQELLDVYESRLGSVDDMVVAVVGHVNPEVVQDLARRYLGRLPSGPDDTFTNRRPAPPTEATRTSVQIESNGLDSVAFVDLYHETTSEATPQSTATAHVLNTVLNHRLSMEGLAHAQIRPRIAPTGGFDSEIRVVVEDYGLDASSPEAPDPDAPSTDAPPADGSSAAIEGAISSVLAVLDGLCAADVGSDDLQRAKQQVTTEYARTVERDLLEALVTTPNLPDVALLTLQQRTLHVDEVSAGDLHELAHTLYCQPGRMEVITVVN